MPDKRGLQPAQVAGLRYKDIDTRGEAADLVLATDGSGGTKAVTPGAIVGATQLDELADVGTAVETAGNVLVADGAKYDGKSPDAGGLVDKSSAQTVGGKKDFTDGIGTDTIDPISGSVVDVNGRLLVNAATVDAEVPTLGQVKAAVAIVTVGHVTDTRAPDFNALNDALDALTALGGGGIVHILDNDSYQATGINGTTRDVRNVTIVGQPGGQVESDRKPIVAFVFAAGYTAAGPSGGRAAIANFRVIGCRLPVKAAVDFQPSAAQDFGVVLDECEFTDLDPFSVSGGGGASEAAIEVNNANDVSVIINDFIETAARRTLGTKWLAQQTAPTGLTEVRLRRLRPNTTGDAAPATIQVVRNVSGGAVDVYHDRTLSPTASGAMNSLLVDPGAASEVLAGLEPRGLEIEVAATANTAIISSGLTVLLLDAAPTAAPTVRKIVTLSGNIAVDISASGANGLDTGVEASSTWYYLYVIGDSTDVNPVAGLLSLSPTAPTLPGGYDVFRRVGAAYNDGSSNLVRAFQKGHWLLYEDQGTAVSTGDPGTTFLAVGTSTRVPAVSTRARVTIWLESGFNNAYMTAYLAHGDKTGATGGQIVEAIAVPGGSGGTGTGTEDVDLNSSGQLAVRRASTNGTGFNQRYDVLVVGYYDPF